LAERYNLNFLQLSSGWCPPFSNDETDYQCRDMNKFVIERIEATQPDVLIIDCHWQHDSEPIYFKGGGDFIAYLQGKIAALKFPGIKKVIVVGQMPTWKSDLPDILARDYVLKNKPIPVRTFAGIDPESLRMDLRMSQIAYPADIFYLSLKKGLCNENGCLTSIGPNLDTDLVVWDYGHLTRAGAIFVVETIIKKPLLEALSIR